MSGPVKSAIISVSDKSGVGELGQHLAGLGVTIYSTGGTFRALQEAGVKAIPIDELTHFPEIMDGRVKTLHPAVFAGILARRSNTKDLDTLAAHELKPIDMVVVNLYPFRQVIERGDAEEDEILENIDIGGPSMLRASAKNFRDVVVVVDPADYGPLIDEMIASKGEVAEPTRRRLAGKVFRHTMEYDTMITRYFEQNPGE